MGADYSCVLIWQHAAGAVPDPDRDGHPAGHVRDGGEDRLREVVPR
ncbi:MAG TPA: hypothetical protein VKU39_01585 [Streptosporangiaceae bacterium]|nr:hypothetical protein [Streptosporangiaceae bacterium]